MIKMSEYTPKTSRLFQEMIANTFTEDLVCALINGEADGGRITRLPFNHLLSPVQTTAGRSWL